MITDEDLQLLTAAVDAELSQANAQRLQQLLDSSPDARAIYVKLTSDSGRLRGLPKLVPPADFTTRVMASIAALTPAPIASPRLEPPAPGRVPTSRKYQQWVPIAIAALVLIGVAGSSFLYFARDDGAEVARNPNRPPPATRNGATDPAWAKWLPVEGVRPSAPMPHERNGNLVVGNNSETHPVAPVEPDGIAIAPEPRGSASRFDPLGAPLFPRLEPFNSVEVRVPFLRPLSEMEREDVRKDLIAELQLEPAYRIDLFTRNMPRAVESIQNVSKATKIALHSDATSMKLLKQGQLGAVMVYTDSLTPTEIASLFNKLNALDARVTPRVFDVLHVTSISRSDEFEIRNVLGADPGLFKRALRQPDRRKELEKGGSVSAGTADQIVKSVTGAQGKSADSTALLMTWHPTHVRTPPTLSAELKSFLAKRGERKPDAVPVIIVIRPGNG